MNCSEEASKYLASLLERNLEVELQAARSEVLAELKAFRQEEFARTILEASDVFMAAAALSRK